ncbi:hypothetical protein [Streptomyces sp. NPDC088812]|uniref:hypothetical protein n=1 Tax=Streptomyces sp. NPDC088812 TaxID=3365905 RepID=UPI003816D5BB
MSDFHAAVASTLMAFGVGMTMIGRGWGTRGEHRGPRRRPVEEYVPAGVLIPALAVHGPGWPTAAFRYCIGCRAEVPVVVHDGAHRCDAHGHVTIHIGGNR